MPAISVWFIRGSLAYLGVGFTIGSVILFNKAVPVIPSAWNFLPMHIEFLLLGFVLQLTMGVAFWIFPRLQTLTDRGDEKKAAWAFVFLTSGYGFAPCPRSLWLPTCLSSGAYSRQRRYYFLY